MDWEPICICKEERKERKEKKKGKESRLLYLFLAALDSKLPPENCKFWKREFVISRVNVIYMSQVGIGLSNQALSTGGHEMPHFEGLKDARRWYNLMIEQAHCQHYNDEMVQCIMV